MFQHVDAPLKGFEQIRHREAVGAFSCFTNASLFLKAIIFSPLSSNFLSFYHRYSPFNSNIRFIFNIIPSIPTRFIHHILTFFTNMNCHYISLYIFIWAYMNLVYTSDVIHVYSEYIILDNIL